VTPCRRWSIARAVLSLGLVVGFGAVGTLAYWSDTATLSGGAFSAGVLDLKLNGADTLDLTSTFKLATMVPGESVAAHVAVQNPAPSSVTFNYTATGLASGALAPYLTFEVFLAGTSSNSTNGSGLRVGACTGTTTGAAQVLSSSASVIASAQQLVVGASQNVCIIAKLATSAPTGSQGTSGSVVLTFNAVQLGTP
jgi:predicted ribosomally synthesized peptide with SipW-like signal peptide